VQDNVRVCVLKAATVDLQDVTQDNQICVVYKNVALAQWQIQTVLGLVVAIAAVVGIHIMFR